MLKNTDKNALLDRIREEYPVFNQMQYERLLARTIEQTDERLERNVAEWLRGDKLSDIWIGRYCVNMVMQIQGGTDFLWALDVLSRYAIDPAVGERLIWRSKR